VATPQVHSLPASTVRETSDGTVTSCSFPVGATGACLSGPNRVTGPAGPHIIRSG
jgi:hypothetical protein